MDFVQRLEVEKLPPAFYAWYKVIQDSGWQYEFVIDGGIIVRVYVSVADDGDWRDIRYGRITGAANVAFKQRVYKPAIVNGNFIENYDVQQEKDRE